MAGRGIRTPITWSRAGRSESGACRVASVLLGFASNMVGRSGRLRGGFGCSVSHLLHKGSRPIVRGQGRSFSTRAHVRLNFCSGRSTHGQIGPGVDSQPG